MVSAISLLHVLQDTSRDWSTPEFFSWNRLNSLIALRLKQSVMNLMWSCIYQYMMFMSAAISEWNKNTSDWRYLLIESLLKWCIHELDIIIESKTTPKQKHTKKGWVGAENTSNKWRYTAESARRRSWRERLGKHTGIGGTIAQWTDLLDINRFASKCPYLQFLALRETWTTTGHAWSRHTPRVNCPGS